MHDIETIQRLNDERTDKAVNGATGDTPEPTHHPKTLISDAARGQLVEVAVLIEGQTHGLTEEVDINGEVLQATILEAFEGSLIYDTTEGIIAHARTVTHKALPEIAPRFEFDFAK